MIDELVLRVEAGDVPASAAADAGSPASEAPQASAPTVEPPQWVEQVAQGRFAGKTVIVTGAGSGSGIGRATASRVAREGGRAIAAIIGAASDRIDGLANIAGIMDDMTPAHEVGDDVWNRVFAINVTGTMKLMRAVVPTMLAQAYGSIVNTASEAALRGSAASAAYTASKHAVAGLTKSSAFVYGPSGIRVNAVAPGPTITNIEAKFASELGAQRVRLAMAVLPDAVEADALAASITFLLSDDGVNLNGVTLPSDGGWSVA